MAQPWLDIVLRGAAAEEHIYSNVKALDINLDHEAREQLSMLVEFPNVYWEKRSKLAWN